MKPDGPRKVLLTGGGVRNGFLWQLAAQQFGGNVERSDVTGLPALSRNAAAAAVLAALTCDGVAGNLPVLTGAAGGRLLGHISPGDGRNWARCTAWLADQTGDYPRTHRAA
jgi:anhydro-N-acetylmuramic acid kinase